jgi:hypothetical protein
MCSAPHVRRHANDVIMKLHRSETVGLLMLRIGNTKRTRVWLVYAIWLALCLLFSLPSLTHGDAGDANAPTHASAVIDR